MQATKDCYTYKHQHQGTAFTGGFSQLLTGHDNSQLVLVPFKNQPEQDGMERSVHGALGAYDTVESSQTGAGNTPTPEPYQILMPVQMSDGQMMALPADQAQVSTAVLC